MGEVGLDDGAAAGVFKNSAHRLRNRKHSGNASPHFLEETAEAKENQRRNRATASSGNSNLSSANSASRGTNLSQSKSPRRVFTSAICPSTRPRAIFSSSSMASDTSKTPRS